MVLTSLSEFFFVPFIISKRLQNVIFGEVNWRKLRPVSLKRCFFPFSSKHFLSTCYLRWWRQHIFPGICEGRLLWALSAFLCNTRPLGFRKGKKREIVGTPSLSALFHCFTCQTPRSVGVWTRTSFPQGQICCWLTSGSYNVSDHSFSFLEWRRLSWRGLGERLWEQWFQLLQILEE